MADLKDLPSQFKTDDEAALKRDLERMSATLLAYSKQVNQDFEATPFVSKITNAGDVQAAFGVLTRVRPFPTGVNVIAPRATPRDAGRKFEIEVMNPTGYVNLKGSVGALVNNSPTGYTLAKFVGYVSVRFDGENFYTDGRL